MRSDTRQQLIAINRRFYDHHATRFSASRQRPWQGWQRVVEHLPPGPLRVLDVGCGNGRFGLFLTAHPGAIDYLGVDDCSELLDHARASLAGKLANVELRQLDLTSTDLVDAVTGASFDLVALFGVLHHLPGHDERRSLLRRLAGAVAPGGLLALSIWRFDTDPGSSRKLLPWKIYNHRAETPIDLDDLEPGDHLLTFHGDRTHPRYCHLADDDEVAALSGAGDSPLMPAARFVADGSAREHNLYVLLRCPRPADRK